MNLLWYFSFLSAGVSIVVVGPNPSADIIVAVQPSSYSVSIGPDMSVSVPVLGYVVSIGPDDVSVHVPAGDVEVLP